MVTTFNTHGQITIPASIRKKQWITPHSKAEVLLENNTIIIKLIPDKTIPTYKDLPNIINSKKTFSDEEINAYLSKEAFLPAEYHNAA
jgi:AbrB family looped-hinge helix DNA binding protein